MSTKTPTPRGIIAPAWKIAGLLDGRVTQWRVPYKPKPLPLAAPKCGRCGETTEQTGVLNDAN